MPIEFFRGVIGIIGAGCAFVLARTAFAVSKGRLPSTRLTGWVIRTLLCMVAITIRHPVDRVDLIVWSLAVVAFGAGWRTAAHAKPPEDLTRQIFPDEE
jgi:hypothetical protein